MDDELGVQNAATVRAASELELALGMDASKQGAEQKAMYEDAGRRLRASAEFFAAHDLQVRAAYAVNLRGVHAMYVGDAEAAANLLAQAVDMTRVNQDAREQAIALANLAWVHNRLGQVAKAAAEYEALLPMIEKDKEPYLYAAALGNYGFCLITLGDFDRALALHNEALALYAAQGKEAERATELSALGSLYFQIGDTQRALDILRMAIAAHERPRQRRRPGGDAARRRQRGGRARTARDRARIPAQGVADRHHAVHRGAHPRAGRRGVARAG